MCPQKYSWQEIEELTVRADAQALIALPQILGEGL